MVDQDGSDALEEIETTYRNAAIPWGTRPLQQEPVEDERMSDEWKRTRDQQGEVVGIIGQRPVVRPFREEEMPDVVVASGGGLDAHSGSGVMVALARLRQQGKE